MTDVAQTRRTLVHRLLGYLSAAFERLGERLSDWFGFNDSDADRYLPPPDPRSVPDRAYVCSCGHASTDFDTIFKHVLVLDPPARDRLTFHHYVAAVKPLPRTKS